MKFTNQNEILPYNGISGEDIYTRFDKISDQIYANCVEDLAPLFKMRTNESVNYTEHENKSFAIESLILGVLWICHANKSGEIKDSTFDEITHLKKLSKLSTVPRDVKQVFYRFRNEQLTKDSEPVILLPELSLTAYYRFIKWLEATEEYTFEVKILHKWFTYWAGKGESQFLFEINSILNAANTFIEFCNEQVQQYFNPEFFTTAIPQIKKDREDYFQVSKPLEEYYLNGIAAVWMNEINRNSYERYEEKLVMAPACMRINNGNNCTAIKDGKYLRCTKCNPGCNISKLNKVGEQEGFEVLIAIHQSAFKANIGQLRGKGVIGIACMSCLVSGGLMLLNKGIHAQCAILTHPGCSKHWSNKGIMTETDLEGIRNITRIYSPNLCNTSDS